MKKEYKFSTPNSDGFNIHLGSSVVFAKDKVLTLNEEQHEELKKLLASGRPDIAQHLIPIDMKAAEDLARKHIETHKPQGQSGAISAPLKPAIADAGKVKPVDVNAPIGGSSRMQALLKGNSEHIQAEANRPVIEPRKIDTIEEDAFHNEDTANLAPKI